MGKDFQGRGGNRGGRGGRGGGGGRGGRGRGGVGFSKPKTLIEPHRLEGIYLATTGKEQVLVTKNFNPGESVYGEKRITIKNKVQLPDGTGDREEEIEYRVWNAFRSKLGAAVINGIKNIYMKPGSKVLYLGAANGTTVSHVSDLVGEEGVVYAVEISERSGRDLINMSKKRPNIVPIIDDARKPQKYRYLIPTLVDVIFADVAQPDQARIIAINARHFLKVGGGFVFSIKANCIDSTLEPEIVFKNQIDLLKKEGLRGKEMTTLEPFERGHAVLAGIFKGIVNDDEKEKEDK